jgi:serine protease Do
LVLCFHDGVTRTWDGGRQDQDLPPYAAAFKSEVDRGGYKVVTPGEDNLFGQQSGATDLQVAAVITDMQIDGCLSHGGEIRGSGTMKVDWQIYSPIKKQVVARASTSANAKLENSEAGGVQRLVSETFAVNTRELVASADFRTAMSAPKALTKGFVMPGQQSKIALAGSLNIPKRQIADATGAVVTILTGTGSGSGFLVSTDGYVLTDAHVVGDEKNVRLRWSDGLETLATVERVSEKRDVAILKTNPRDRAPLALRRGPVTPGQRVYAIGSPGGRKFESTVSSGVISSDRVFGGLRYIQSDTTVSHGSSGGPLLDENGAVIGLTDLGLPNAGPTGEEGPAGLNLFTPIGDAMDFLALEQK